MLSANIRMVWFGSLFALLVTAAAADLQFRPGLEAYLQRLGYHSVPLIRNDNNHLIARGLLNGRERDFLVDTGWTITTIDKRVGRKLKSLGDLKVKLQDSFLGVLTDPAIVLLESVRFGDAVFTNQPARLRSLMISGRRADHDAVLGADFLLRNHCLIDCLDRRLYVRSSAPSRDVREALAQSLNKSGFREIDLRPINGLGMACNAQVNDLPVRLLVDTGGIWTVLDNSQAKRLGLKPRETNHKVGGVGKIGSTWLDVATANTLELGEVKLAKVRVGIAELEGWGIASETVKDHDVQGILGAEQLSLNGALIDCPRLKLWLNPVKIAQ